MIGNKDYNDAVGPLRNPVNDIERLAAVLKSQPLAFKVLPLVIDASRIEILGAVTDFAKELRQGGPNAVGFFYYSGHGAAKTVQGPNYLIPVDVDSVDDEIVWDASVRLDTIIDRLVEKAPRARHFVVFDACRNELKTNDRSPLKGFVPVRNNPSGVFIAFAAAPNRRASDGYGRSSPYAEALEKYLRIGGLHHRDMFHCTKIAVDRGTGGKQTPWERNGLLDDVYFAGRNSQKLEKKYLNNDQDGGTQEPCEIAIRASSSRPLQKEFASLQRGESDTNDTELLKSLINQFKRSSDALLALANRRLEQLEGINPQPSSRVTPLSARDPNGASTLPQNVQRVILGLAGEDIDKQFAYYPPGSIKAGPGIGREGDRRLYLPHDIVFPVQVPEGEHAFMNSQIYDYGGVKGPGGSGQCDPRNYDRYSNRDNFCEPRSWSMRLCPSGKGHQGQDIRPPTCNANRWSAVAVEDGVITAVTSNTTVNLIGKSGTIYRYLGMDKSSITVKRGQRVKRGEILGRISNVMGGKPGSTSIHLHIDAHKKIHKSQKIETVHLPVYASLISAYRRMKGLDPLITQNGELGVDPKREIPVEYTETAQGQSQN